MSYNRKTTFLSAAAAGLLLASGVAVSYSKEICSQPLAFTELPSKPGLKCTDFVNVFNYKELTPVPAAHGYRPGIEVNFYNRVFKTHDVPTEENDYGFLQGKCHATIMNKDGTPSKFECAQTMVDSDMNTLAMRGVADMATGMIKYAILGGTGKYLGAWGEFDAAFAEADEPVLGETTEMYHYGGAVYYRCHEKETDQKQE